MNTKNRKPNRPPAHATERFDNMEIPPAAQSVNAMVSTFHGIAASHAAVEISIGKILVPPPDIQIAWNNIILTKEQIYIDEFLLKGYARFTRGDTNLPHETGHFHTGNAKGSSRISDAKGSIRTGTMPMMGGYKDPSFVPHTHRVRSGYKASISGDYKADADCDYKADATSDYTSSVVTTNLGLHAGDLVSLLPIQGGQQFIVLGKLIYMPDWKYTEPAERGKYYER